MLISILQAQLQQLKEDKEKGFWVKKSMWELYARLTAEVWNTMKNISSSDSLSECYQGLEED